MNFNPIRVLLLLADNGTGQDLHFQLDELDSIKVVRIAHSQRMALNQVGDWNWTATVIGVGSLLLIFAIQRFIPKLPAALTAVVISSVIVQNPPFTFTRLCPNLD